MIRTLVAHRGGLVRGALAHLLGAERDIEVVGQTSRYEDLVDAVLTHHPDVAVLDVDRLPGGPGRWSGDLPCLWTLRHALPGCRVLLLTETRRAAALTAILSRPLPGLGFVATNGSPGRLVAGVRRLRMSPGTVRNHLSRVLGKTGARTRIEAVRMAQDAGWI